ncbi:GAF domain-containing protein [Okeanomitos corallinicola TIOX110]|uniref:GAF domain-containing protein n=1 Tax=Okeanomitos corallinicola TIOX110 TaxID=3133117 RepID=A0ABZ2UUI8_9CYAN
MQTYSNAEFENIPNHPLEQGLQQLLERLISKMQRDELIRNTINQVRESLEVDRVVLYYFYEEWYGQVTFESLISQELSIFGSTGAENCFNYEYAALYLAGRTKAIADIELEPIETCHRDFLRSIQVRANLVVPVLVPRGLWGLLIAHQCHKPRLWLETDIKMMQIAAQTLSTDSNVLES